MSASDDYTLRARIAPALIAVAPPVALALTAIPFTPSEAKVIPVVVAAFTVIAGQLGRDAGETRERGLFETWGGPPTTAMLRHSMPGSGGLSDAMLARRHRQLEQLWGGGLSMPTSAQQQADPGAADQTIGDAVSVLRAHTRDPTKFPLLAAENVNYGFRRNCLGLKHRAVVLALLTIVAGAAVGVTLGIHKSPNSGYAFAIPFGVALLALFFWPTVTEGWVRKAARRYARSLLETLDVLEAA